MDSTPAASTGNPGCAGVGAWVVWDGGQFAFGSHVGTIGAMIVALRNERGRKMISCREAAEAYGCTMSYIRRLARLGRLEHEEVGGTYVFDEAEVKRLAAQAAKAEGRQRKRAVRFKPG